MMRRSLLALVLLPVALLVVSGAAAVADEGFAVDPAVSLPSHQVVAIYFHRTVRCPTCRKISSYIDEAIKTTFERELKARDVEWHMVDFQDSRNRQLVESYKITSPTLVVTDMHQGEVREWQAMPKVWSLVGQKEKFLAYVEAGVNTYLKEEPHP